MHHLQCNAPCCVEHQNNNVAQLEILHKQLAQTPDMSLVNESIFKSAGWSKHLGSNLKKLKWFFFNHDPLIWTGKGTGEKGKRQGEQGEGQEDDQRSSVYVGPLGPRSSLFPVQ